MPTARIPLVGSLINRNSNPDSFYVEGQQFTNCYPELTQNQITGIGAVALYKRLGVISAANAGAGYAGLGGGRVWLGVGKAVFPYLNGTNLQVWRSDGVQIGNTIANVSGGTLITETTYLNLPTLTMMLKSSVDSLNHCWFIKNGDVTWTEIVDVDFPVNQATPLQIDGAMAHLDGYSFVIDRSGKVWNSDINNITSWTATGFTTAQKSPDVGTGIAITKNLLVAFGLGTIEFFQNAGNPTGSPLTRLAASAINVGSTRVGTGFNPARIEVGDSIYFFSTGLSAGPLGMFQLTGTTLKKVSNPAIDKLISANSLTTQYGFAGTVQAHGMLHIMLYTGTNVTVPCYCVETGAWWYWKNGANIAYRSSVDFAGKTYMVGPTEKLYTMDNSTPVFVDDGSTMTMTIQTANVDHGTRKRKYYKSAEIVADRRTTSGNSTLSYSDDDYLSFSTERTIDFSQTTHASARLTRLGSGARRAWKFEDSINAPFRGERLDIEFDVGLT